MSPGFQIPAQCASKRAHLGRENRGARSGSHVQAIKPNKPKGREPPEGRSEDWKMVPLPVRGDPSGWESPMGSRREEKSGLRTILGPARTILPVVDWSRPGTHARTPGSRAIRGKAYRQSLGHICTMTSSPSGDSLVVDIRDSRCIVGAHQHMVTSQVWDLETLPVSPNNWNAK